MKRGIFLLLVLSFLLSMFDLSLAAARTYNCVPSSKGPVFDGKIKNDAFWKDIPEATGFFTFEKDSLTKKQTIFKMSYLPASALYIGIICEEPDIEKIKAESRDGGNIYSDDSVEVFLFPQDAETYFQFAVNTIGARFNTTKYYYQKFPLWDWEAKTYTGKDFYSLEIKIPFEVLGRIPQAEEKWKFNICRNNYTSKGTLYSSWAKTNQSFHEPSIFATLIFEAPILIEKELYEECLKREIKKIELSIENTINNWKRKSLEESRKNPLFRNQPLFKEKLSLFFEDWSRKWKEINASDLTSLSLNKLEKKLQTLVSFRFSLLEELEKSLESLKRDFLKDFLFEKIDLAVET